MRASFCNQTGACLNGCLVTNGMQVGRDFVHRKFRTSAYLTEMLRVSEQFLDGQRGIQFKHEIDCIYNGTDNSQSYHVMLPFHPPNLSTRTAFSSLAAVLNDAPTRRVTPGEEN